MSTNSINTDVYKCILRSLSEAVCAVDGNRRVVCFNRQAQRLTGIDLQDALGAPVENLFPGQTGKLCSVISGVLESGHGGGW